MKKIFGIIISLVISGALFAQRAPNITMNKRVWKLGERIEVKCSGLNSSKKYIVGAFPRKTSNNKNPMKTRSIKGKSSGSVYMRLRSDQGVKAGKYEFHIYRPGQNNILDRVNLVLTNDDVDPVDPPTGSTSFTASSGTTDLNYADTTTFISEYKKLGFIHDGYQTKVKKSQLISFLTAKKNMHFHSGHGSSGSILCTDGSLYVKNMAGKIQTVYSIYAICSSFASSDWSRVMGSNAKMVMGFNKTVTDGSCLTMAKNFPSHIANGESYLMAWYKTNAAINLHKDRWATYVKEGSKVVLYKAGGETPKEIFRGSPVLLSDYIIIDKNSLYLWGKENFGRAPGPFHAKKIHLGIGKKCQWPRKKTKINQYDAIDKALLNDIPLNAELDTIIPIEKCIKNKCFVVAQNVHFAQKYNGFKIRNNSISNFISILISDNEISIDAEWSEIEDSINTFNVTLSVGQALEMAANDISNIVREPVIIVNYDRVYGLSEEILFPAFEFIGTKGERFVVNAFDGSLI